MPENDVGATPAVSDGFAPLRQSGQAVLALATWAEGLALRVAGAIRVIVLLAVVVAVACGWLLGRTLDASPVVQALLVFAAMCPAGVLWTFHWAVRRVIGLPRRMTEMMTGTARTTVDAVGAATQALRTRRPTFRELLSGVSEARTLVNSGKAAAGLLSDSRQLLLAFNPLSLAVVAGAVVLVMGQMLLIGAILIFSA